MLKVQLALTEVNFADENSINVFVSKQGSDEGSGSWYQPVKSLQKAVDIAGDSIKDSNVIIRIFPGVYKSQKIRINSQQVSDKHSLIIKSFDSLKKPVFDGEGESRFLTLNSSLSSPSHLHIKGLNIENYNEGISLNGKRHKGWNSENTIENCSFKNIGNKYSNFDKAYAVLRLLNSRDNVIKNNTFKNNISTQHSRLLHSIYLAHESNNNKISHNTFEKISGDAIRIRDFSNNNLIIKNKFINTSYPRVTFTSTWYCEKAISDKCTARIPECPSQGNDVVKNLSTNDIVNVTVNPPSDTFCNRNITAEDFNRLEKNGDISSGICKVQALEACPRMLKNSNEIADFLNEDSHQSASKCKKRAAAYYGSCKKNITGPYYNAVAASWYKRENGKYKKHSTKYSGKGCYVMAENCHRMNLSDHKIKQDKRKIYQNSPSKCTGQLLKNYYSSCSRNTPRKPRFVEMMYLNKNTATKSLTGHGCLVKANHCSRMNIQPNTYKVDIKASAHANLNACKNRLSAWLNSCSKGESEDTKVKVEMIYFNQGHEVGRERGHTYGKQRH